MASKAFKTNTKNKGIPVRHLNSSAKEPYPSENFIIRDLRDLLAGKDMVQELHRHDFYFLLAVEKGAGDHAIDFESYKVSGHCVFFMRPGQVHELTLKAGSRGYLVQFKTDFYRPLDKISKQVLRKASGSDFYRFDAQGFKKINTLLLDILEENTQRDEQYEEVIKANLGIIFIELSRKSKSVSNKVNSYAQERLEEFLELLEQHIAENKQVSQYADMLNLSLYQLNAITKAALGKTGSELINEFVILESKRFLLATSDQVSQIAWQLGYEDVSYFIRFFKKHTGYTPEAFRHNFG
jgi:AraC family transcriptional activator of pobA